MRSVEICRKGYYGGIEGNGPAEFCIGEFHGFFSAGSSEEGIFPYALVELPGGTIRQVETHHMKFIETPPKSNSGDSKNVNQQLKSAISLLHLAKVPIENYISLKKSEATFAIYDKINEFLSETADI